MVYLTLSMEWHPAYNGRGVLDHKGVHPSQRFSREQAEMWNRVSPSDDDRVSSFLHPVLRLWRRRRRGRGGPRRGLYMLCGRFRYLKVW